MTDLATSIEGILDAIVAALEAEAVTDGVLDGIEKVIRGPAARPLPAMPALWMIPDQATFQQAAYGVETWSLPVTIAALVKGTDPAAAAADSQRFAAKARGVALAARPTDASIELTDIVSQTFDPTAHSSEANRTLFWTEVTVLVTFDCDS